MKKCVIAFMLAAVLLFGGCVPSNTNPGATTAAGQPTTTVTEPTHPTEDTGLYPANCPNISCQVFPEQVDAPEGVPVLKWVVLTGDLFSAPRPISRDSNWSESAGRELNLLAEQLGLPFRIQFVVFTTTCATGLDWFRVPEVLEAMQSCDLITGILTQEQMPEYLLPVTNYTDNILKNTVPHAAAWGGTTSAGEVYGVPCYIRYPMANGWVVAEELFAEFGFREHIFDEPFWEMSLTFAQLYETNGHKGFLMPQNSGVSISQYNGITTWLPIDLSFAVNNQFSCIGACFAVDYSGEKPAVVNLFRTEYVRKTLEAMQRYAEKGYYAESVEDGLLEYGICYSDAVTVRESDGRTWYCIPQGQLVYQAGADLMLTGILKGSGNASAALGLLEQLGENEQFRKQLLWGTEGKDYSIVEGERIPQAREDGAYNMQFLSAMGWFDLETWADFDAFICVEEGTTRLETYRETVDASRGRQNIPFDYSTVMTETEAVLEILDANKYWIADMRQEQYDAMLQKIRDAGEEYIIAELQRQLEAWLEANPGALG